MKKMLTFLIATILILAMSLMPLQAITGINSLVSYGEGNEIEGGCNGKNVDLGEGLSGLMVSNQSELVFIGNDDFKIKVGKPVKEFEIIDDVDNDGLKDVAVYIDSEDDYDDFKIVSSKTSKVLYATKYSYNTINDNNEAVNKNATIRQILFNDNIVYLIYNYHLVGISTKDYQVVFDYEAKDNIWKMALVNNQVIFTTQLGELGSLNKTNGKLNYTVASSQLLINIFEHNTPLHDGAVIIRGDRVVAATCYLPLSDNNNLNKALGTRHRAGVGISEVTDSMTIIVSEETGKVSVAVGGELIHDIDADSLRNKLEYLRRRTIDVKSFKIWRGRLKHEGKDV